MLLHPSAAPENPPSFTTEQLHETSQAISGTAQELFTQQITCDFGLLWPAKGQEMGSVEEEACSPSALHKLLLWAPLPQLRLASSVRNLHPFCLLGQVNITNHVWVFFFFLFLSFNLSSLFKTTDVWETFEYFEDLATKLIMKWLEHFTQICSPAERFSGALLA